jgi:hypothetical protein
MNIDRQEHQETHELRTERLRATLRLHLADATSQAEGGNPATVLGALERAKRTAELLTEHLERPSNLWRRP